MGNDLEQRTLDRIAAEYPPDLRPRAADALRAYEGREPERVIWDILALSKGDIAKLESFVASAQKDYRDILYWAEYYDSDPLLQGKDPQRLVEEMLAKLRRE